MVRMIMKSLTMLIFRIQLHIPCRPLEGWTALPKSLSIGRADIDCDLARQDHV